MMAEISIIIIFLTHVSVSVSNICSVWKDFFHKAGALSLQPKLSNSSTKTASFLSCSFVRTREDSHWPELGYVPMGMMGRLARHSLSL